MDPQKNRNNGDQSDEKSLKKNEAPTRKHEKIGQWMNQAANDRNCKNLHRENHPDTLKIEATNKRAQQFQRTKQTPRAAKPQNLFPQQAHVSVNKRRNQIYGYDQWIAFPQVENQHQKKTQRKTKRNTQEAKVPENKRLELLNSMEMQPQPIEHAINKKLKSILKKATRSEPSTQQQQSEPNLKPCKRVTFAETTQYRILFEVPATALTMKIGNGRIVGGLGVQHWPSDQKQTNAVNRRNHTQSKSSEISSLQCKFCSSHPALGQKKNSHEMYNPDGTVQCRYLRQVVCPLCKATGDYAHTRKHCPWH